LEARRKHSCYSGLYAYAIDHNGYKIILESNFTAILCDDSNREIMRLVKPYKSSKGSISTVPHAKLYLQVNEEQEVTFGPAHKVIELMDRTQKPFIPNFERVLL